MIKNYPYPELPEPGKTQYNTFCEIAKEYNQNKDTLLFIADIEKQKRYDTYNAYCPSAHSDRRPHFHPFKDSIDLGSGYSAHVGMDWPQKGSGSLDLITSLTKDFVMANGYEYTLGEVNIDGVMKPAFFTSFFWEIFGDTAKIGKNGFFLNLASRMKSLYSWSNNTGEIRWLLYEGLVFGRRYCQFDVFHDFTDEIQYMDDWDEDDMEDEMWNGL